MYKLIGVGGRKRSGKDSVCDILVSEFNFKKIAFADNLRVLCGTIFDIPVELFLNDQKKELEFADGVNLTVEHCNNILDWMIERHQHLIEEKVWNVNVMWEKYIGMKLTSPRHILQIVGTELIRNHVSASYHADVVFDKINKDPYSHYCISDVRFPNERKAVNKHGGQTLLVYSHTDDHSVKHDSEAQIGTAKDYDSIIFNDKESLDKLRKTIKSHFQMEHRRVKAFEFSSQLANTCGVPIQAMKLILNSLPEDTVITGASYDPQYNSYLMFFESKEFQGVPPSMNIPRFHPVFKTSGNGVITLESNGIIN